VLKTRVLVKCNPFASPWNKTFKLGVSVKKNENWCFSATFETSYTLFNIFFDAYYFFFRIIFSSSKFAYAWVYVGLMTWYFCFFNSTIIPVLKGSPFVYCAISSNIYIRVVFFSCIEKINILMVIFFTLRQITKK